MPRVTTELEYGSVFQLLVAVILSAQCTDKRVNMITPALFERYPDAKSMAEAEPDEVFEYVLGGLGRIEILNRVGDLVFDEEVDVYDIVVACDHTAFVFNSRIFRGRGIGSVSDLNLLVYVEVNLFHSLYAEGKLEVHTCVCSACYLAECVNNSLFLFVNSKPTRRSNSKH